VKRTGDRRQETGDRRQEFRSSGVQEFKSYRRQNPTTERQAVRMNGMEV
jgi:hypothetical protein